MPQLSKATFIGATNKKKKIANVQFTISPAYPVTGCTVVNFANVGGVVSLTTGAAYNLTPNTTFTANVMIWGAGGGSFSGSSFNGGGGGFATGIITFFANVSYNVVVGVGGTTSGTGGGGSGIEYLANANVFLVAGGGGGVGSGGAGGAGGGWFAANGAGGTAATAFSATSPGALRRGGDGAGGSGFGNGGGTNGGGGGGLYGGGTSTGGGGGGGGFADATLVASSNLQTGSGIHTAANTMSGYIAPFGQGGAFTPTHSAGSNGAIIITLM